MHLHNMKSNSYLMCYTKANINIRCGAIQFLNSDRENILYTALGSEAQKVIGQRQQKETAKGNSQLQKMFTSQKDEVIYTKMYKEHITLNKEQIHIIYTKQIRSLE